MTRASDQDCSTARLLLDEFFLLGGSPLDRLVSMANQHWPEAEAGAKAELVEALLPVFQDIVEHGGTVQDRHRGLCEAIVVTWLKRQ